MSQLTDVYPMALPQAQVVLAPEPELPPAPAFCAPPPSVIKVLGLGGAGSNAVDRMIQLGLSGIEFIAANTDAQALLRSEAPAKIQLGPRLTRGLGAGGRPEVGEEAAEESREALAQALTGADMIFIAAGMGGGTGTGAAPVAAEIARKTGAVTIAVVTTPFGFEAQRRAAAARAGIEKLRRQVDTLITVPNDRLLQVLPKNVSLEVAFHVADDVLRQGMQGIAELVTRPGLINVDFAHIRALMKVAGGALMAVGQGRGPQKALDAARQALHHPLLDLGAIDHAAGVLVHFTGGEDLALHEIHQAIQMITQAAAPEAEVVFGATIDMTMTGRAQVILIATGVGGKPLNEALAGASHLVIQHRPAGPAPELETPEGETPRPTPPAVDARKLQWLVAEEAPPARENLDLPAFLRRRKSLE